MMATYFRVQRAERDPSDLLDPSSQFSHAWNGDPAHDREGVSVCDSLDDLALYLASHLGAALGQAVRSGAWVIVEVEAVRVPSAKMIDPEFESLVRPTAIVAVRPVDDEFLAMIDAAAAELAAYGSSDWDD